MVTYIQSGNVLFTAASRDQLTLRYRKSARSDLQLPGERRPALAEADADIVERAPDGFGAQPAKYRYDVIFLKAPLTAPTAR